MQRIESRLTVYFDAPFWVGVYERISDGKLDACKITFGTEPKEYEVYDFIPKHYYELRFSPAVEADLNKAAKNPKRIHREVNKQLQNMGIGTKSQQALKLQREQAKSERKATSHEQKEEIKRRRFEQKQQKKKAKHKGK